MIRKTSETRALAGTIVNEYSNTQTNAYSTEYSNKAFGGTILWTNPSPTNNFAEQTITINNLTDYDMYMVIANNDTSDSQRKLTTIAMVGYGGFILSNRGAYRPFRNLSDNVITFYPNFDKDNNVANSNSIPLYIIGYKTGLF